MKLGLIFAICGLLALAAGHGFGQSVESAWLEDSPAVASRVVSPVDDAWLVRLEGNTHFLARAEFDRGLVNPQLRMERMQLVLKRSPEQEAALEKFMAGQQDAKSPNYHRWLDPEEFGKLYGPSDADISMVANWLQNHGFEIYRVSNGRVTIEFSGTAAQVNETFHTEMHRFLVDGVEHIANDRDPEIPAALAPVIAGVASLHDFFPRHQSEFGRFVKRNLKTGKFTPLDEGEDGPTPFFTYGSGPAHEDISPYDFAIIYNLLPAWNAGIDGTGETVAIAGLSDIVQADVDTFRKSFDLPASTVQQVHNGADPGLNGAQGENSLDVEWSGAAAKGAAIMLVVSATTATTYGGQLSASYIVDTKLVNGKVAPIMSASYGNCEIGLGTAGNAALNGIYQQGAAEGISIFISSGDQGSTGCDNSDAAGPNPAVYGLQVNGWASSPYVTAVGGTDFNWNKSTNQSTYWNATNNPVTGASAKGYIPELPWNSTCASTWLLAQTTAANSEAVCEADDSYSFLQPLVKVTGGSGGVSACTTSTGGMFASCAGGYAKPAWQTGVGVPADGKRDLPDVSLFASDGWPNGTALVGSAYLFCMSSLTPDKSCNYSSSTDLVYEESGGTSISSPAMAGIMAMVLQSVSGAAQGLANPMLYKLAAKESAASCNSNTVAGGNSCVFYDITSGTNAQVCKTGSRNCVTNKSGDTLGVVSGYSSTTGFDLTTGLGSVNASNLVTAWRSAIAPSPITLSPSSLTFPNTVPGAASVAQVVNIKNTGTASVTFSSISITGTDPTSFLQLNACGASLAAGASCAVLVALTPAATGAQTATLSVADNAVGSPQTVALSGTGTVAPSVVLSATSLTFASTAEGTTSDEQSVTVTNSGSATLGIASIRLTGANPASFTQLNSCGIALAPAASCTIYVAFKPAATGALTGSLTITDSGSGSPQTVKLAGTGVS